MPIYKVGKIKNNEGLQKYRVRVNYNDELGHKKQLTRVAYGIDVAKDMERRLEFQIKTEHEMPVKKMTLQELFNDYIETKKFEVRETTLDKSKRIINYYILPILKDVYIDKLTVTVFKKWKLSMEKRKLSVVTKNNVYTELRAMLNYAVRMEYIQKHQLNKVGNFKDVLSRKKEMNFYTPEEFKKFIKVAKNQAQFKEKNNNSLYEWNFYVFFNIAFYTGLRKGEIHALRWTDIDGNYLKVTKSISQKLKKGDTETPPKNKSSIRIIQIPLPLIDILQEHKKRQQINPQYSEDSRILGDGRCIRDTTLEERNKYYAKLAGVKKIRIHDFRHSHASLLVNMGINIQQVAKRLGHTKVEITWNTYSHLYPREEERAIEILNAV
ncbi:MAG: site-specific integrase [Clostridia bacterium]|nr:site-specific integrase [Clostridia bacterium]